MRRPFFVFSFVLASFSLAACNGSDQAASSSRTPGIEALTGNAASGKTAFEQNCVSCHGSDGKSGSAHENVPQVAASESATLINTVIAGRGQMPSFSSLSDQTIADLVAYARSIN